MTKKLSFTVAYRHVESNTQTTHTYGKNWTKTNKRTKTTTAKIHAIKILFTSMLFFFARKEEEKGMMAYVE